MELDEPPSPPKKEQNKQVPSPVSTTVCLSQNNTECIVKLPGVS